MQPRKVDPPVCRPGATEATLRALCRTAPWWWAGGRAGTLGDRATDEAVRSCGQACGLPQPFLGHTNTLYLNPHTGALTPRQSTRAAVSKSVSL